MSRIFKGEIVKHGDNFAVTLPQEVLKHLDVIEEDEVNVSLEAVDCITVRKVVKRNLIDLDLHDGLQDLFIHHGATLKGLVDK